MGDQLVCLTKNMHTLMQGTISYIRMCNYLRHESNNQTETHTVNKKMTENFMGTN